MLIRQDPSPKVHKKKEWYINPAGSAELDDLVEDISTATRLPTDRALNLDDLEQLGTWVEG